MKNSITNQKVFLMLSCSSHSGHKRFVLLLVALLIATAPAFAQISYETYSHHKQLRKQFLKQADTTVSPYKDTHLDVSSYNFKKGEPGRTRVERRRYQKSREKDNPKKRLFFWKKKEKRQKEKSVN
ncbi:hypothetical protein ACSX1A_15650 [Pontibacter sp. MBLB2868]|uniref:hypothetical protein n=1 Tax=Pontibacter sp. MBLB2868 TaxID=3451555 RepID=UPI003F750418